MEQQKPWCSGLHLGSMLEICVGHDLASDLVTVAEASPPAVLQPDVRHVSDHLSLKLVLQPS